MEPNEPHVDRPGQPMLSEARGYTPKRSRWPGLVAVAVLLAAAVGGMVVTGRNDSQPSGSSVDRNVQSTTPQAQPSTPQAGDDTRVAQPAKSTPPAQP